MLSETIQRTVASINRYQTGMQEASSARTYIGNLNALLKVCASLETCLNIADAMKQSDVLQSSPLSSEQLDTLTEAINDCGNAIASESKGPDLAVSTVKVLENAVKASISQLNQTWKTDAERYAGNTAGYLTLIADLSGNPGEIRSLVQKIRTGQSSNPTPAVIQAFTSTMEKAKARQAEFQIDSKVERFLRSVQNRSATIAVLTPEILAWIQENHLSRKLKITF